MKMADEVAIALFGAARTAAISKPQMRWRVAFAVIYSSRAIARLAGDSISRLIPLPRSTSYTTIDMDIDDAYGTRSDSSVNHKLSAVDAKLVSSLVKNKDHGALEQFEGIDGLAAALLSEKDHGIDDEGKDDGAFRSRKALFGSNTYVRPKPKGFLSFALDAAKDTMLVILLVCAAVSLAFGIKEHGVKEGWYDGASIFIAVFLVVAVTAVSNFRQDRRFERLSGESGNIQVSVVRGGRRQDVSIFDVVVGDVAFLKIGDQVPADGVFLEGHSLRIDESSMTGETAHIAVDRHSNPFLSSGTKVADGYGSMLVTAVGMSTTWGEMMTTISRDNSDPTPLQERLERLTSSIGKIGALVAALVLAVLLVRYFTGSTTDENGKKEFDRRAVSASSVISALVRIVSDAVTIVVVAIPEGLPLAVTLTLAYSMKRMMADKSMVRKLPACETMGAVTTICTDKTGTLTLNQMKVVQFFVGEEQVEAASIAGRSNLLELLCYGVGLNTTGSVYKPHATAEPEITGSPTEKAILSWAVKDLGMEMNEVKQSCSVLNVEAFNSQKKRSGVLMRRAGANGTTINQVHWKGAAEMVLAKCSHYHESNGSMKAMSGEARTKLEATIQGMAANSLRCIAFAYRQVNEADIAVDEEGNVAKLEEEGLTLLGIVGLKDPCRPEVRKAVQTCRSAGVDVKMITGDNIFTARAIAVESGILESHERDMDGVVIEGKTFREYSQEERMEKVGKIRVMARSSPFDKLLMVQCLKQKGEVVAVTGDGTNDAPALKEANVGLSMGIQGTEVAKECSDIVILDDNFGSVVTVLRWGRCVYNNIQKFIQFQLTVNAAALTINFVAAASSGKMPLTTVQMLWVNLIMDTLGALALATERPTKELMDKPPVGRTAPLITNVMWRNLLSQALFQIAVLLTLQFAGESILKVDEKVKNTVIFNTFVLCQVFNEFNARKLEKRNVFEGIHRNHLFLGIIAVTIVLQVIMVEFLKKFADTERLNWGQWGICVAIACMSWPIGWVVKCIPVSEEPFFGLLGLGQRKKN